MPGGGEGFRTTLESQGYKVEIELTPARAGENMLMATVRDASGKVVTTMADLELIAALPSAGITDVRVKGQKMDNGMWHVMISDLIIPGEWTLGVDAFVTEYDKVSFETKVTLR